MSEYSSDTAARKGMALVTGGSRGIGTAICKRLASDGYSVAVAYGQSADGAHAVVEAIRDAGGVAAAFKANMSDVESIHRLFHEAEDHLGRLSVLVANAGILGETTRVDEQTSESIERVLQVNTFAPMVCAQEAVRRLSTRHDGPGGSIILMSSVAAQAGGAAGLVSYGASKGALEAFVKGLAREVAAEDVRVNAVAPGVIDTDMPPAGLRARIEEAVPMRRLGRPEEIADAVAWLASDQSSFVTGESITVSGGR